MDSKVIQYLPTSGKGHGILYVNQYSKQTRLFNPNSAITESGKAEDKCMPESFTETAMEGRKNGVKGSQGKTLAFVSEIFNHTVHEFTDLRSLAATNYTADGPSQTHAGNPSSESSIYEDGLKCLPYYICEDLISVWIDIIQPGMRYCSSLEPAWWPDSVPFKRPQSLHKFEKVKLLIVLLDGKLQEVATAQELTIAAEHSGGTSYSEIHQHTLEGILQRYATQKKQLSGEPMNWLQIVLRDDTVQPSIR